LPHKDNRDRIKNVDTQQILLIYGNTFPWKRTDWPSFTMNDLWASAVVAALVSAFVSGLFIFMNNKRKIKVEIVMLEQAKWREKMRELCAELFRVALCNKIEDRQARLEELRCAF
jgi:hypothetical protein